MLNRYAVSLLTLLLLATAVFSINKTDYVPGQLIVKLQTTGAQSSLGKASAVNSTLQKYGASAVESLFKTPTNSELDNLFLVTVSDNVDIKELAEKISVDADIEYAQPNYLHKVTAVPDDPLKSQQYYLDNLGLYDAWDISQGAKDVIIAIIDTGVDYNHEDLADNIWNNEDEVEDSTDSDGNGYVDDIRGYDFVNNASDVAPGEDGDLADNDPMDFNGHGTNVAGSASAVTDNATGIAGVGWNCSIMPLRAGYKGRDGNGYVQTGAAIQAIYYATRNGAAIINASFGGVLADYAERDAFRYAYNNGVLCIKAAGNDNSDVPPIPGKEDWMFSVAAVTSADRRSSFSNYGTWVKVAAPGSAVYTTNRNDRYGSTQGTSFSAPIVAGVAGLVKAAHPDWSPAQIMMHIVDTADNIDAANPGYEGLLGKKGRVNAAAALSLPFQSQPELVVTKVSVEDLLTGNANGGIDIGETLNLILQIKNRWQDATNVNLVLSTDDPTVEMLDNSSFAASIPGIGSPTNYIDTLPDHFSIRVSEHAFPHNVKFNLQISADGGFYEEIEFQVAIEARVLFVDDDDGQLNVEDYYYAALDSIGMPYDIWDRAVQGPLGSTMRNYDIVIWSGESALPSLEEDDTEDIKSYLRQGKALFLAGQNIAWDMCAAQSNDDLLDRNYENQNRATGGKSKLFYENYVQAKFVDDATSYSKIVGVESQPISRGLESTVFEPLRLNNEQSRDVVQTAPFGKALFTYPDGSVAATITERLGRVISFAFGGFEAISDEDVRLTVMQRILHYFTGVSVEVENLIYVDGQVDDFIVNAIVKSDSVPNAVNLYWRTLDQTHYTVVPMTAVNDSLWQGAIPQQATGATLEYGAQAFMEGGLYSPIKLKQLLLQKKAPLAAALTNKKTSLSRSPYVTMLATHETPIDTSSGMVVFWTADTEPDSLPLDYLGDNTFGGLIPKQFNFEDSLYYQFKVKDVTTNPSLGVSPIYSMQLGFENFESGLDDWLVEEGGWGLDDLRKRSGTFSLSESPGGDHPDNANLTARLKRGFDFSDVDLAKLTVWQMYGFQPGDSGYVEISIDNGEFWQQVGETVSGAVGSFKETEYIITGAEGQAHVLLRFRFVSDDANSGPGWFIDDISIRKYENAVAEQADTLPTEFALFDNFPNPFNNSTMLRYALPNDADVQLSIYNTIGQKVVTLVDETKSAGVHAITWNGQNSDGQLVPSGLYFYRFQADAFSDVRKLMMIK
jgi:subtilisin family serine protease